ncbi:MAG TPA: response regulator [Thermoanaerobaculia bacterium]|nr:response regulator [Thermoanaerobaculia bacterium]
MANRLRGVLVIDHDAAERGSIVRKLVGDGIRADVAQNATDAIRLLEESRYEVVVLDWQLPDGEGARVVSHLQRSGERRERIMVMTGEPRVPRSIDGSLVKGVLFKPVDAIALTAHVRAMLS